MLVLTRKTRQSIMVGDDIEITIVEIRGDAVKVAINAPRHIAVHRKEIYEEIQRENREASAVTADNISAIERLFDPSK